MEKIVCLSALLTLLLSMIFLLMVVSKSNITKQDLETTRDAVVVIHPKH